MFKNLLVLLILFTSIYSETYKEQAIRNIPIWTEKYNTLMTKYVPAMLSAVKLGAYGYQYKAVQNYEDMHPDILNWCKTILKKYDFKDIEKINFKTAPENSACTWVTLPNNTITIHPTWAKQLLETINNPADINYDRITAVNEFVLLHEMSHLLNNDCLCQTLAFPLTQLIKSKFSNLIKEQSEKFLNLNNTSTLGKTLLKLYVTYCSISLSSIAAVELNKKYMQYHENKADNFAITKLNDVKKIDMAINWFKKLHEQELDLLTQTDTKEIMAQIKKIAPFAVMHFTLAYSITKFAYEKTKTTETFRQWLTNNPDSLRQLHFTYDPAHPMSLDRANKLEARKQEIIKAQNLLNPEPEIEINQAAIAG